ncbi:UDP-N-acetylmuramoyl-L-alanyl-D-glutamate--2,6-diaminopimelate ligase [Swingsia samuiensis]|uniref:UDP-N-acetylmuramoyl-L-alanyl-D-glutamate--2,6-diaminopimelate ligase n=1 Tax=Swingsia samuiensis TaxID=1293412 RepID=A0A4Y6UNH6_9PROT|nr:UDP-N-acetylmuramoyl-L-alanyl-D-glutamate--2,6-diaminopimelate ligase [Swingsia samuiensis]QDH17931.1 UDP-N-acetylmuramoyl-L-alanyl-D-glutamate--2,6-diaminopimelate ligase [Swingsia samuiensis]
MRLSEILHLIPSPTAQLAYDPDIYSVAINSRTVQKQTLFFALKGTHLNGADYIPQALTNGADAIISETPISEITHSFPDDFPILYLANAKHLLALAASQLAGPQPTSIAAITGTNGKSSTAEFLRQLWSLQGKNAASLGTLGLITNANIPPPPSLTTPDSISLANTLALLAKNNVQHVALEASSHGLEQHRLDGVKITAAGFSNLTRDHLDYHKTIEAYRNAKTRLFADLLPHTGIAAINADMDPQTVRDLTHIAANRGIKLRSVGKRGTSLRLIHHQPTPSGQTITLALNGEELAPIDLPLPGLFQAENALLAAAMCWENDNTAYDVLKLLPSLTGVRGRCERAVELSNGATAYVDYAHTPDALEHVLASLRPHTTGRLIVVFGAGGDRDRGKRPLMGDVASKMADIAIITDDNPRSEDPTLIRAEIKAACPDAIEIADRRAAIAAGLDALQAGDILVVAGKGHEQGQTVGQTVLPFDDRQVLRELAGVA